jgi:acylphosphatase
MRISLWRKEEKYYSGILFVIRNVNNGGLIASFPRKRNMNHDKKIRVHLIISGKVQGVYFRYNTQIIASQHNVTGWVRNLEGGRVEVVLEGDEINIGHVIKWCKMGPPGAKVEYVDIHSESYTGEFNGFNVNY